MILILTDREEATTDLIIDWLVHLKKKFIRISRENKISMQKVYQSSEGFEAIFKIKFDDKIEEIDTKQISSYWYRRSELHINLVNLQESGNMKEIEQNAIERHLNFEQLALLRILDDILSRKNIINSYRDNSISKLDILQKAQSVGLLIPNTIICSD